MSAIKQPLVFTPILKTAVWGGDLLKSKLPNPPAAPVGESWEISDQGDNCSVVAAGEFAGKTLRELLPAVVGAGVDPQAPAVFPLLLKIIEARENLSVQVHPDDAYAKRHEPAALGKTEAWYVLAAAAGSKIYCGLRPEVTRESLAAAAAAGEFTALLQAWPARPGDIFFIPAGMVHALGAGVVIAEIQQNSDITYRLDDWRRVGFDGKPRELHLKDGLQATCLDSTETTPPPAALPSAHCRHQRMVACRKFNLEYLSGFRAAVELDTRGRECHLLLTARGAVTVAAGGVSVTCPEYSSCLLPCQTGAYTIAPQKNDTELLLAYRPL